MNWLCTTLSQTLDKTGSEIKLVVSEMGLLLFGCSWSPSFGIGVTSAVFHFDGKTHVRKDSLTIDIIV